MLKRLSVENYALIDHLDIEFPGGLVIITGETGAGKSILLGALSLVLGAKADVSVVKNTARNCVVEALFETSDRDIIIRRVISPSGRSRSFIDDEPASLEKLKEYAAVLVDIHSQHQQLLLADHRFQMTSLDGFASLSDLLGKYTSVYASYMEESSRLSCLKAQVSSDATEREYMEFQYNRLEALHLSDGELQQLEEEQSRLANMEQIKESVARVEGLFAGETMSVESALKGISNQLESLSAYIPEFSQLAARAESSRIELKDIAMEVSSKGETLSYSPERLAEVEQRLAQLYDMMRKHSVEDIPSLIAIRDGLSARLGESVDRELEVEASEARLSALERECEALSQQIHEARLKAAPELADVLQQQIRSLEMPLAVFDIELVKKERFGPDGFDEVRFLFNANGGDLQDLSKCASGGELSRIMLCIKSMMARYTGMPTMLFDEIDTGVSGSVADKMGDLISRMGERMQIFAITHLPQVAGKGNAHFLVYKSMGEGNTLQTNIRQVTGEDRVNELARMLSGSALTPEAVANARVLLDIRQ